MRAVVWRTTEEPVAVEDVTMDEVGAGEVRVRIAAAGVCHSDLHIVSGDWDGIAAPMILGHEGSGVVEEVAPDVTGLEVGDHVVLSWIAPCGECVLCRGGRVTQCLRHANLLAGGGVLADGSSRLHLGDETIYHYSGVSSFAEQAIVPASGAIKVRKDAPLESISLVGCAVATGVGAALNTAKVEKGSSVLIVGCGGVGLSIIQGARIAGASTIIAVDLQDEKLELALKLGATHTINARESDVLEAVGEMVAGGVDYSFDAIGGEITAAQCIRSLAVGGSAVMVGIPASGLTAGFDPQVLVDLDQRIIASNYGHIVPAVDIPALVDRFMNGELLLEEMISARVGLDGAGAALENLRTGTSLRQLILPNREGATA